MNALQATLATLALAATTAAPAAQANDYEASMRDYLESEVLLWVFDGVVIDAIRAQNEAHAGMTQARINTLDAQWQEEVGTASHPLVDQVLNNPASMYLTVQMNNSAGAVTEIFLMDAHGLNVAATGPTSDYWQGDEAKFRETYRVGPGAVHVGEVELDESTQTYQGQVSLSVLDPDTKEVIGAVTVGLNAELLY